MLLMIFRNLKWRRTGCVVMYKNNAKKNIFLILWIVFCFQYFTYLG